MGSTWDGAGNGALRAWRRGAIADVTAPDGSAVFVLVDGTRGASKLSVAEAVVGPGERSDCVSHRTIEEVWYVLRGVGTFHRAGPDGSGAEEVEIGSGDAILIPTGYRFWVENTGTGELAFLCFDAPGWPGHDEAILHDH